MKLPYLTLPLLAAFVVDSSAADATWNLNGDGSWADDGNWNPAVAPGASGGTTNPDTATFGTIISAARAVTVDADRNLSGMNFAGNSSAYNLSGGSLVLTSGGIIQTSGGGSGHTDSIASPITLANQDAGNSGTLSILSGSTTTTRLLVLNGPLTGVATSGTSTLTLGGSNTGNNNISGVISNGTGGGNLAVEKTGAGSWILSGANTFSGGLTIRAGELRVATPGGTAAPGTGAITLGDTTGSANATLRVDNSFAPTNALVVSAGSGTKTITNGNVGSPGYNGPISLGAPLTVAVTTTSNTTNTNFTLGGASGISLGSHQLTLSLVQGAATGTPTNNATITVSKPVSGTGSILVQGGGTSTGTRTVAISGTNSYTGGTTVGGTGSTRPLVVNVSGDQSAATGGWNIDITNETGGFANTVNFASGSTVSVASGKSITLGGTGGHFSPRTLNAAGTVTNDGTLLVRRASTVNITGAWTQNGITTVATQGGGQAALNINTGGSFTYAPAGNFQLNTSTSNDIVTNLAVTGGTFTTGAAIRNNTTNLSPNDSAYSQVILNDGGTLKLSADVPQLLTSSGANIRLQLGATGVGGVIDTNGFNTTIDRPVLDIPTQAGKLVKRGDGALTLSGPFSYTGSTTVEEGTLSLASASLADDSSVTVATGATLALNFTGTDDVAAITLGSAPPLGPGTYSASTHPGLLSGTGALRIPASDPFLAWIEPFFPGETDPAIVGRDADPDGDGVPNAVEYFTGGTPDEPADRGLLWVGVNANQLVISLAIRGESTTFSADPAPAATVDGISLTVQGSTTLTAFDSPVSAVPLYVPPSWPGTPPAGFSFHSFKLDASTGLPNRGFLRVRAD